MMKRYKPSMNDKKYVGMQMDSQGPYVLYSDAEAVERERDQWRDLCARQGMQLKNVERENGELKAEKIRIEKVMQLGCQDSESVCPYWQTVKDWEKECESLELKITNLQAALAAAQGEVERMREVIEIMIQFIPDGWEMPLGFNQVAQQAREALRKTNHE